MRGLFLGKRLHWLVIVVIIAVLYWLGATRFHLFDYDAFLFVLLGLAGGAVIVILVTSRKGERITREPFDEA